MTVAGHGVVKVCKVGEGVPVLRVLCQNLIKHTGVHRVKMYYDEVFTVGEAHEVYVCSGKSSALFGTRCEHEYAE